MHVSSKEEECSGSGLAVLFLFVCSISPSSPAPNGIFLVLLAVVAAHEQRPRA